MQTHRSTSHPSNMLRRPLLLAAVFLSACSERTPHARARDEPAPVSLAPIAPPRLPDAAASPAPGSLAIHSSPQDAGPPAPHPFKFGFCGPGRMWIYPNPGCGSAAKAKCVPVPAPMEDLHCGCDGVTYSLANAPWVYGGFCWHYSHDASD